MDQPHIFKLILLIYADWLNLTSTIVNKRIKNKRIKNLTAVLVILFWKSQFICADCADGAACKYVKGFKTATGWYGAELGVKVHFDVWASRGAWESPRAQGGGVPQGISRGCLIESFYLWSQPHLSGFAELQYSKRTRSPRGTTGGRRDSLHSADLRKIPAPLCTVCSSVMENLGEERGGHGGITKITKKTLRLSWKLQGRLKNFNADFQITRFDTAVSRK